jgi:hypothetical protein
MTGGCCPLRHREREREVGIEQRKIRASKGERGVHHQVERERGGAKSLRERMENETLSLSIYSVSGILG